RRDARCCGAFAAGHDRGGGSPAAWAAPGPPSRSTSRVWRGRAPSGVARRGGGGPSPFEGRPPERAPPGAAAFGGGAADAVRGGGARGRQGAKAMTEQTAAGVDPNSVRKVVGVQAPPEVAWRVFTQRMGSWWPLATYKIGKANAVDAVIEPRVGGRWYERGDDG